MELEQKLMGFYIRKKVKFMNTLKKTIACNINMHQYFQSRGINIHKIIHINNINSSEKKEVSFLNLCIRNHSMRKFKYFSPVNFATLFTVH
jgi:hypothetical protein